MNDLKINDAVTVDRKSNFWFPGKHNGTVVGMTAKRIKVKMENGIVATYHPKNVKAQ